MSPQYLFLNFMLPGSSGSHDSRGSAPKQGDAGGLRPPTTVRSKALRQVFFEPSLSGGDDSFSSANLPPRSPGNQSRVGAAYRGNHSPGLAFSQDLAI